MSCDVYIYRENVSFGSCRAARLKTAHNPLLAAMGKWAFMDLQSTAISYNHFCKKKNKKHCVNRKITVDSGELTTRDFSFPPILEFPSRALDVQAASAASEGE